VLTLSNKVNEIISSCQAVVDKISVVGKFSSFGDNFLGQFIYYNSILLRIAI
jgi:hypothetical protein